MSEHEIVMHREAELAEPRPIVPVGELDRRLREAERRIQEQESLVQSLKKDGRNATQAAFDLSRMHLLQLLLEQVRLRVLEESSPIRR